MTESSRLTAASARRAIVVTGGPGAGKTAVLEVARRDLRPPVEILPEAASIVFGGGFPRRNDDHGRRAAQRVIYRVQVELERMTLDDASGTATLCDRGTIDGLAYWPGRWEDFFSDVGTTLERELARYAAVVHLRVPGAAIGYRGSSLRIESAAEAEDIDRRLLEVWAGHPRRVIIETDSDFFLKTARTLEVFRALLSETGVDGDTPR